MNSDKLTFTAIGVVLLLLLVFVVCDCKENFEGKKALKYYRCDKAPINKATKEIFEEEGITKTKDSKEADIYLTCGYNGVEREYDTIPDNDYIHAIKGGDKIVAKNGLWSLMKNHYGRDEATKYVPNTYLLASVADKLELLKNTKDNIYILKKNLQRQEGLKFAKRKELSVANLNGLKNEDYVLIQEYLDDPFLINGRKVNMRVYLLIVIKDNVKYGYVYTDGFMYYTKKGYKYSTDPDEGITTGYIDRKTYEENPMTHSDLRQFLIDKGYNYKLLFSNIQLLIGKVLDAISPALESTKGKVNYQLFGLDVQPDPQFNVKLIEVNKGPSLQTMDKKDAKVKSKLQQDIYKTIGIKDNINNQFSLIWKKQIHR